MKSIQNIASKAHVLCIYIYTNIYEYTYIYIYNYIYIYIIKYSVQQTCCRELLLYIHNMI